jgi:hypothetical protein
VRWEILGIDHFGRNPALFCSRSRGFETRQTAEQGISQLKQGEIGHSNFPPKNGCRNLAFARLRTCQAERFRIPAGFYPVKLGIENLGAKPGVEVAHTQNKAKGEK